MWLLIKFNNNKENPFKLFKVPSRISEIEFGPEVNGELETRWTISIDSPFELRRYLIRSTGYKGFITSISNNYGVTECFYDLTVYKFFEDDSDYHDFCLDYKYNSQSDASLPNIEDNPNIITRLEILDNLYKNAFTEFYHKYIDEYNIGNVNHICFEFDEVSVNREKLLCIEDENKKKRSKDKKSLLNKETSSDNIIVKFKNNNYLNVKRENKGMDFSKILNIDCGKIISDDIAASIYGVAIKGLDGRFRAFDKSKGTIVDVTGTTFDSDDMLWIIPCALKDISVGDVIINAGNYVTVTKIHSDGTFSVVDPKASEQKIAIPAKNMFGFDFISKVFCMTDGFIKPSPDEPFGINPLMLIALSNKENMNDIMLFSMFGGQNIDSSLLPFLFMGRGDNSNIGSMIIMSQLLNNQKKDDAAAKKTDNPFSVKTVPLGIKDTETEPKTDPSGTVICYEDNE